MSNAQIFGHNYLAEAISIQASSEETGFSASNLLDYQRRSKIWRSAGAWAVTSANNQIIFEEQAGVPLTATIPPLNYTSTANLLPSIQGSMNAAGAANYSVSLDQSTGRIRIGSNGAHFSLLSANPGFTAASMLGFSTSVNRSGALFYVADSLKISTGEWLSFDLGTSILPKAFLAVGERNKGVQLSPTAVIRLEANHVDSWGAPAFSQDLLYNRHILSLSNVEGISETGFRYWRLVIEDPGAINGYVELGCIYLGDMWVAERGAIKFPYSKQTKDFSDVAFSESGHATVFKRQKTEIINVEWNFLTTQDCEDLADHWELFGKTEPFFINLDPGAVFSVSRNRHFKLVRFEDEPNFDLTHAGIWESNMSFREEL